MTAAANIDAHPNELSFGRVLRRLPLYFGLAFAGIAVITLLIALSIHFGMTGYVTGGWIGFVGYTGLLFWIVVRQSKLHWSRWSFWLMTFWLLIFHCSIFVSILRVYPQWRIIWFWPMTVVEAGVIGAIVEGVFPEKHAKHHGIKTI